MGTTVPVYAALLESMARKMTLSAILGDPSLPPASES